MEIRITSKHFLMVLLVLSWLIFVGLCIEAGGLIFNTFYALTINPVAAKSYWMKVDLSALLAFDRIHFFAQAFLMIIVAVLKAWLFYLIIRILHNKKLNMALPFNKTVIGFVSHMAYLALMIGFFSTWVGNYAQWLMKQGVSMPDVHELKSSGGDVWLFMGVILLVVAQIFKRGAEIQSENELTV